METLLSDVYFQAAHIVVRPARLIGLQVAVLYRPLVFRRILDYKKVISLKLEQV